MPPPKREQVNIDYKGVHTFEKDQNETGDRAKALWVVEWIIDGGKNRYRNLEKREFFRDKDSGEWKLGKSKGLNLKDVTLITNKENFPVLMRALGSLLPEHQPKPAEGGTETAPAAAPVDDMPNRPASEF